MTSGKALLLGALATSVAFGGAVLATAGPAAASAGATVVQTPAAYTPFLASKNSNIAQLVKCGPTMYAVGEFSLIGVPGGKTYNRHNAFSFDAATGRLSSWQLHTNGPMYSIALSADCTQIYIGGDFTRVNHAKHPYLVKINAKSGAVYSTFAPRPDKYVSTVVRLGKRILVGGRFTVIGGQRRTTMASVLRSTGAATSYLNETVTGTLSGNAGPTRVFKFEVSPTGKRLLAMGNFTQVAGKARTQVFMLKLDKNPVTLSTWTSPMFAKTCAKTEPYYVRAGAWSPDGRRVYLATTGGHGTSPICDSVSAYSGSAASHNPIWVNKAGCDSLYSIAADATTVYVGGHERWIDNANGCDKKGAGASDRPGVGAVSAKTGHSVAWNPTRTRGLGADDLLRTSAGLWIASDNYYDSTACGHKFHPGICYFPNG